MGKVIPLTKDQIKLVEENISVIRSAIHSRIIADNRKIGLEAEDLYQEGCVLLCRAAQKYDESKNVSFRSFAYIVIVNGLISYCKKVNARQRVMMPLTDDDRDRFMSGDASLEEQAAENDLLSFLESVKKEYSGTVKLGIDVLILKAKGYSGAEIAKMYGVKPNLIGARQARAMKKLSGNTVFHKYMDEYRSS